MQLILIFTWLLAILSVAGAILNIYKSRLGFLIWAVTNAAWVIYDYSIGAYAQSALFFVYFLLAVVGIIKWGKDEDIVISNNSDT